MGSGIADDRGVKAVQVLEGGDDGWRRGSPQVQGEFLEFGTGRERGCELYSATA
jgi:hypothetical protein